MNTNFSPEQLREFMLQTWKMGLMAIKPWKLKFHDYENQEYVRGWNECVKEMTKRSKELIKRLEEVPYERREESKN